METDPEKLMKMGEKISNLTRMYNFKNGRTAKEDTLPARFFEEKQEAGMFKDKYLTREIFAEWLQNYYNIRGWTKDGYPTKEKLESLGIKEL